MQPDNHVAGNARDWLRYARSDLALASLSPSAGIMLETFCFHSQQAAEKAIKAVLIQILFPLKFVMIRFFCRRRLTVPFTALKSKL